MEYFEQMKITTENVRDEIMAWVECGKYQDQLEKFYQMLLLEAVLTNYLGVLMPSNTRIGFPDYRTWTTQ